MQQNMALKNQNVNQPIGGGAYHRNTNSVLQAQTYQHLNTTQQKSSRQGSKIRKNISNMRGGAQTQLKNAQRVSYQRRFNNTTLDKYQENAANNHLSTLQAGVPALTANNMAVSNIQTIQQQPLAPSAQYHHHNTGSKYEQQLANNQATASMLKPSGHAANGAGPRAGPVQSRSVIRQNQQ